MRRVSAASILCLALALGPSRATADAMVRTQAMLAGTIAEYFVSVDEVRVELEVGLGDIEAFANLLPDELYERLGREPVPFATRLERFAAHDLVIVADQGPPLPVRILGIEPRERLRRDEITGDELPVEAGEKNETTLFVQLSYPLRDRPRTLTLFGPRGDSAGVGFVAYHEGIAVNDFRYLTGEQTLTLDWGDPWYTTFERRALRRQYFAPMSGFIYVEPYEVRKEIIVRPLDLQRWTDLGLAGRETIPAGMQAEIRRKAGEFLRDHHPVRIDGREIEPELARVNFLERTLRTSRVIDPPVDLDAHGAVLGVIFVYPTSGLPQQVTLEWDLWNERIAQVPVAAVDQAGALPSTLEPDWRVLEWKNFLKNPRMPELLVLAAPPHPVARWIWRLRWALGLAALLAAGILLTPRRRVRRGARASLALACVPLLAVGGALWLGSAHRLSDARARELVSGLLHNVYRAFDFRAEEQIYDVLARSAEGELLERIYLETRRGLVLASQGGARTKVKEIELIDLHIEPAEGGAFHATAAWNVTGSVGHWGHVHERRNRYRAALHVTPRDGAWKLTHLEILEEERL